MKINKLDKVVEFLVLCNIILKYNIERSEKELNMMTKFQLLMNNNSMRKS